MKVMLLGLKPFHYILHPSDDSEPTYFAMMFVILLSLSRSSSCQVILMIHFSSAFNSLSWDLRIHEPSNSSYIIITLGFYAPFKTSIHSYPMSCISFIHLSFQCMPLLSFVVGQLMVECLLNLKVPLKQPFSTNGPSSGPHSAI